MAQSDTSSDTIVKVSGDNQIVNQGNDTFSVEETEEDDDDSITGIGTDAAVDGFVNSDTIYTGNGKDSITGIGKGAGTGIVNYATIDTGNGKDSITGEGGEQGIGILNDGIINTGRGKDIVDALNGGFGGYGIVSLGRGDDILSGFGTGWFYGGKGTDALILPSGTYTVGVSGGQVTFTLDGVTMNTAGFEVLQIGDNSYDFSNLLPIVS